MIETKLELKRIYTFEYNGVRRLALLLEDQNSNNTLCWDFVDQSYKSFNEFKIVNPVDVTSKCVVSEDENRKWANPRVRTFSYEGLQYAVQF